MEQKNVLVLFGGTSPEHDISIKSANTLIGALGRHLAIPVYITDKGRWLLYDGKLTNLTGINWGVFGTRAVLCGERGVGGLLRIVGDKVRTIPVDVCLPVLHGEDGEDGMAAALCKAAGIPCAGSPMEAGAAAMDKALAKMIAKNVGAAVVPHLTFEADEIKSQDAGCLKKIRYKLGYPCFVKPARGGSSVGISRAGDRAELANALNIAAGYCNKVVVERLTVGRELEVSVLEIDRVPQAFGPGEVLSQGRFYDYDEKYITGRTGVAPIADIPADVAESARSTALDIFKAIGARGLARVDFFWSDGKLLFNEINTMPGMTDISMFPKTLAACGYDLPDVLDILIDGAVGGVDL